MPASGRRRSVNCLTASLPARHHREHEQHDQRFAPAFRTNSQTTKPSPITISGMLAVSDIAFQTSRVDRPAVHDGEQR